MNNRKIINLMTALASQLEDKTIAFYIRELDERHGNSDTLNVIINAHIASLATVLRVMARHIENENDRKAIEDFVLELCERVKQIPLYVPLELI